MSNLGGEASGVLVDATQLIVSHGFLLCEKEKFPKELSTRYKHLDWVLRHIEMRLMDMAKDANTWLNTCSPETRGAISEGYVMTTLPSYLTLSSDHDPSFDL